MRDASRRLASIVCLVTLCLVVLSTAENRVCALDSVAGRSPERAGVCLLLLLSLGPGLYKWAGPGVPMASGPGRPLWAQTTLHSTPHWKDSITSIRTRQASSVWHFTFNGSDSAERVDLLYLRICLLNSSSRLSHRWFFASQPRLQYVCLRRSLQCAPEST